MQRYSHLYDLVFPHVDQCCVFILQTFRINGLAVWLRLGAVNAEEQDTQGVCPCGAYLLVWVTDDKLTVIRDRKKREQSKRNSGFGGEGGRGRHCVSSKLCDRNCSKC